MNARRHEYFGTNVWCPLFCEPRNKRETLAGKYSWSNMYSSFRPLLIEIKEKRKCLRQINNKFKKEEKTQKSVVVSLIRDAKSKIWSMKLFCLEARIILVTLWLVERRNLDAVCVWIFWLEQKLYKWMRNPGETCKLSCLEPVSGLILRICTAEECFLWNITSQTLSINTEIERLKKLFIFISYLTWFTKPCPGNFGHWEEVWVIVCFLTVLNMHDC